MINTSGGAGRRVERGQFNDVVIFGEEKVLRYPRTAATLADLPRISRLLSHLDVGVAVPRPLPESCPDFPLGQAFLALTYLPGTPWRPEWTVPVADFTALLARMSTVDQMSDLAPRPDWAEFAAGVRDELFPLMSARGRNRAAGELDRLLQLDTSEATLVHGDLGGANLRFAQGRLVGVLDWDEAHLGDPAADLASIAVTVGWPGGPRHRPRTGAGGSGVRRDVRAAAGTARAARRRPGQPGRRPRRLPQLTGKPGAAPVVASWATSAADGEDNGSVAGAVRTPVVARNDRKDAS